MGSKHLQAYFAWCRKNPVTSAYPPDRIDAHWALAEEYLGEFKNESGTGASVWSAKRSKFRKSKTQEATQTKRDVLQGPDRQIAKLRAMLNISDEQVEQIKPILEEREQQLRKVSEDTSLNREVRHMKLIDIVDESKARLQLLLSEAQRIILLEREHAHKVKQ
jgi:hypothetical protein